MECKEVDLHGYRMEDLEQECAKMAEQMKECGLDVDSLVRFVNGEKQ